MANRAGKGQTPAEITDYAAELAERHGLREAERIIMLSDWPEEAKKIAWKEIAVRRKSGER